jgi:ADP-heptose:LPS heptosyltransferase
VDLAQSESHSRVLIIFPGALGDLICLGPAIRAIARRHPRASLELMARMELARFAVGRLGIVSAHSIDRAEMSQLFMGDAAFADGARDFFASFARIYSFFAAADERFRRALTTIAKDVGFYPFAPPGDEHVATAYMRAIGEPGGPLDWRIEVMPEDRAAALKRLAGLGLEARAFLLILPGSGSRRKNWQVEKFIELAERGIAELSPIAVLGPAEAELHGVFRDRRIATLSDLELGEVAGLASCARAFVGNDSGVTHLAAATGTPGVAIFGPTDPLRWRPFGAVRVIHREPIEEVAVEEVAALIRAGTAGSVSPFA